jgi:hypothetical protein
MISSHFVSLPRNPSPFRVQPSLVTHAGSEVEKAIAHCNARSSEKQLLVSRFFIWHSGRLWR